MQTIRNLLLMKHNGLSDQQVADALKIAKGSVNAFHNRYKSSGLGWPIPSSTTDAELRAIIYPPTQSHTSQPSTPDWSSLEVQLSRPGVTLQLLWEEYFSSTPKGQGRTVFYDAYKAYRRKHDPSMVMVHKGGDKLFVDYSGDGLSYVDRITGELHPVQVFVSDWGASGYAFVDVTPRKARRIGPSPTCEPLNITDAYRQF